MPTSLDYDLSQKNKKILDFIEDATSHADEIQKNVLAEILSHNANVEYLQRHGLNGHTDSETFKKLLPIISYEDIKHDINRIANGDTSPILTSNPISNFLTSSGTSGGERKLMPATEEELERRYFLYSLLMPIFSQFVPDLEKGTLNLLITDTSVREAVMKILKLDENLANFIEFECSKNSWQGIITRLWPNTKYVDVIVTGAMSQYIPTLEYYSNGLPLVCTMYASSECYFGVNLNPLCKPCQVSYTLIPTMCYYEFLPVNRSNDPLNEKEKQELVDLVDVKLGQEYELVVTTYAGLYRYKVGDVLKVTGFKNKAPQFSFVCRKNVVLSIESDKTDEVELQNAMKNAMTHLVPFDADVAEYTSYADTTTIPGHYCLSTKSSFG
ncbi:hypothetical protein TSUD_101750 [Trifolium subterraneum]|uniref:GH3 middle domain-containing protein n=1 Tax=Trifolium subterraneum TaxID=3900 RepID=A0A2Z6MM81_TRISU|nr:hypothetical protein TSUD_101750 [Trifolium subterraneum]